MGDGGPYRQFFQDISAELMPENLKGNMQTLLRPCANREALEMTGKDRFVLNSNMQSSEDLQKYYYLGVLMGVCLRTGTLMPLNLPKAFWKSIAGQKINLDDLAEVELSFVKSMGEMLTWEELIFESIPTYWDTEFADGNKIDLLKFESLEKDENSSEMVEFKDKFEYVKKCLLARLTIFTSQTNAIKQGINAIVPEALFNVGSFDDLETWICGSCRIDLELLKAHT
jgi:hypothetical protein